LFSAISFFSTFLRIDFHVQSYNGQGNHIETEECYIAIPAGVMTSSRELGFLTPVIWKANAHQEWKNKEKPQQEQKPLLIDSHLEIFPCQICPLQAYVRYPGLWVNPGIHIKYSENYSHVVRFITFFRPLGVYPLQQ
jgi:hypothetical protein